MVSTDEAEPAPNIVRFGEGAAGVVAQSGLPLVVGQLYTPTPAGARPDVSLGGSGSITAPMIWGGRVTGVLQVVFSRPTPRFDATAVDLLTLFANHSAIALANAQLYEQVQAHAAALEQRVAERTAELQEIIAGLESFSYMVSHDLQAPLQIIMGYAELIVMLGGGESIQDTTSPVSESVEFARLISTGASRMAELIRDLLTYSQLSRTELELEPVALADCLAEVRRELDVVLRERGAAVEVQGELPIVHGQRTVLKQVLTNLIGNATKYVAPGVAPRVLVRAEIRPPGAVRVWIEDNGIGVAPEDRERIFRPFERAHASEYAGTGIGLAIVRKGTERMGGRVGLESLPGYGSRFWIELRLH